MPIQNPHQLNLPPSLRGDGLVLPYETHTPAIGEEVYLAANSVVIGRTQLGDHVSVWFGAVLRGDIAPIEVGEGSNIQDNAVLHVGDDDPCIVGRNVVVGHLAMLHGCKIEDDCTIGMSAVILNKALIGKGSLVGAGALVTQGTIVPPYSLVLGSPAKVVRELTEQERKGAAVFAPKYVGVARNYREQSIE
ncbi:MAG: gamma carbonic anhydrase family protein [Candidatus Omnitrophica bacterium]|nr:gamma carbonic anhydrase family protein [Candidatus Omnitrophota bacterium]